MVICSEGKNYYLIDRHAPQVLLVHPIIKHFNDMEELGIDIQKWINNIGSGEFELTDVESISKEELVFYLTYYNFLKSAGYSNESKGSPPAKKHYSANLIKLYLANSEKIVFEVTDACNLKCRYCGYGELYEGFDKRENKNLSIAAAKTFLEYFDNLRKEKSNQRLFKKLCISFYGGEPLLNFPFIKEIVEYTKNNEWSHGIVSFGMTTNGLLINKYLDFLVENNFLLSISLDGNEVNNAYRLTLDGKASFKTVFHNIITLKEEYPEYFEKNVSFLAVNHKKNSIKSLERYFDTTFGKPVMVSEMSMVGVRRDRVEDFFKIYRKVYESLKPNELEDFKKNPKSLVRFPGRIRMKHFIKEFTGNTIDKYSQLLDDVGGNLVTQTGTCDPFKQKVFITANGMILTCERIPHIYSLGEVDDNEVRIDYQKISDEYNYWYRKMEKLCKKCTRRRFCTQCLFHLNLNEESPQCPQYEDAEKMKNNIIKSISTFEHLPALYLDLLKG